jgi:transposase InsO family protein
MSKARLVITAVVVEGRSKSEVARDYDVSRYWVHQLVKRYQAEGEAAFEPRSRRPHTSPHATPAEVEDQIIRLRKSLSRQGLDAGADTIRTHLARRTPRSAPDDRATAAAPTSASVVPSLATIWRILTRRGFVTPQPQKRPKSSWRSFAAEQPNERWQADTTHWQLADGTEVEILNLLDDHSRLALASTPRRTITGPDVLATFQEAFLRWGIPASVLTDNGAVFTGKQRGGGRVALEVELGTRGVRFDHSRPYHPQTCGKVERFQQTQKKWLAAQPPARTVAGLRHQLSRFRRYYNDVRPHRALGRRTPPCRPTPPGPRPPPPAPSSSRTGGSGTTASTKAAPSPCGTIAGCTTSASADA